MNQITKTKLYSIDLLKFLASIAVVLIHVQGNFRPYEMVINTQLWDLELAVYFFSKWSVPIFIMCSGYFLLNDKKDLPYMEFIKKRLSKVLIPFLAASLLFTIHYQNMSGDVSAKWAIVGLVKNILGYPASAHLWFIYPLIGIYLLTPLFKGIMDKLDGKIVIVIIGICFMVKTVLPFTDIIAEWQTNYWRDIPIATNAFALYFILGGYLGRIELKKGYKLGLYALTAITLAVSFIAMFKIEFLYNRSLEVLLDISSINNVLLSVSLFIAFKDMRINNIKNKFGKVILNTLSEINFGVFLFHPIFIDILKPYFNTTGNIAMSVFAQLAVVYIATGIFVFVLKRIPLLKKIA